ASPSSNITNVTIAAYAGGPYIDVKFDTHPSSATQTSDITLSAYIKNVGNETAENSTINWTLPTGFTINSGSADMLIGNITIGNLNRSTLNISVTPNTEAGTANVSVFGEGYGMNYDKGAETSTNDTESVLMSITCNSNDGTCGTGCSDDESSSFYDADCVASDTPGGGGGGGAGGGAKDRFLSTSEIIEIIRGQDTEFTIEVKNDFNSEMQDIEITISGVLANYLSLSPSTISSLAPGETETIIVQLTAPKYFSSGSHDLEFTITGNLHTGGQSYVNVKVQKLILLIIHEIDRDTAEEYLNNAKEMLDRMIQADLKTEEAETLYNQIEQAFNSNNYNGVYNYYQDFYSVAGTALEAYDLINEIDEMLEEVRDKGIDTPNTDRLLELAKSALSRGDWDTALSRAKEAKLTLAVETKGEFKLGYFVRNNWHRLLLSSAILAALITVGTFRWKLGDINRELKRLREQEKILLQLMKQVQKECFEQHKMSMTEYREAMLQYEEKLGKTIQKLIELETMKQNLFKFKPKKLRLLNESKKIVSMIKDTQKKYLEKGTVETTIYKSKMDNLTSRLSEIEEKLATIEAHEALKKATHVKRRRRKEKG
ncbi:MAG: hypothetical protein GPJ50_11015, partial [Candidatus Heimdallarchaeota archaeon]|nr:hypothetical protein [Candidatus Heimdallarchaeota archaeon]